MPEIIDALAHAEVDACEAFVDRQHAAELEPLVKGMSTLQTCVRTAQLERPAELMAYKYPAMHDPLPDGEPQRVLQASVAEGTNALADLLADMSFDNLAALNSIAGFLKEAAERRQSQQHTPESARV